MDLMGLSPEQINALTNTGINSNALLLDAARAVGAQDVARQRNEILGRTEEFNITLPDGQQRKLAIPLTEIDSVINAMNRTARNPSEIALAEQLTLQAKARMQNYQAQTRETNEMLPFKKASESALEDQRRSSALKDTVASYLSAATGPQVIEKSYSDASKAQADAMIAGQEQNRNAELAAAANRIAGVPMVKWPEGPYAKDAATVNPGAMAALANKIQIGEKQLSPNETVKVQEYITQMARTIKEGDKTKTPVDMQNFNSANQMINSPFVAYPDEKNRTRMRVLPVVDGKQLNYGHVVESAKRKGVSPFDILRELYKELEGKE
jgi:hypothetical protein